MLGTLTLKRENFIDEFTVKDIESHCTAALINPLRLMTQWIVRQIFSFVATNSIAHQHRRKCPSRYTLISFLHDGILRKLPENCGYSAIPLARFNIEMNKGLGWIRMKRQSRRGRSFSTIKTNLLLMPNSNFWNCSNALNFTFPERNSCFWRGAGVYAWSGQYLCLVRTLFLSDFCAKIILGKFSW